MSKIIAHRGYSALYPENTLLSFEKALQVNAFGVECDLQKTKDNHYIIIHDCHLSRLTGIDGYVKDLDFKEIRRAKINKEHSILELEEFLKIYPQNKFLNLELKDDTLSKEDLQPIYQIIRKYSNLQNCVISSFNHQFLFFFKEKRIKVGALFYQNHLKSPLKTLLVINKLRPDYFNLPVNMFYQPFGGLLKILLLISTWFKVKYIFWVVNNDKDFKRVNSLADYIITDNPELMNSLINR